MDANPPMQNRESVAAHRLLKPTAGSAWFSGFDNMFAKEIGDWFHTRRWIWQLIIWVGILNGLMGFIMYLVPTIDEAAQQSGNGLGDPMVFGLSFFFQMAIIGGTIGTIILSMDEIVGEKQTGTAAWILSKPVSRSVFILSKLLANTIGILIFIVLVPGAIAIAEISISAQRLVDLPSFLLAEGVLLLGLMFYLTLSLMLGVFFHQRGGVIGICMGLFFGASLVVNFFPKIVYALPVMFQNIAPGVAAGMSLSQEMVIEIIATAAWCVVFIAIALWRFQRQEL